MWLNILIPMHRPHMLFCASQVAAGNILLLHGGYRSNLYFDELWQYNRTAEAWRLKKWYALVAL